ncbi:hypothetical protein Tcan_06070 [Toxocara canis]|uniref:Uncharacterized protein n=1 Tax=Toxocara canis TaxID=6265 RepID=A0A0B2W0J4_TOXCA|nr:hypothetical protein Tcan_06070 [Toxocara canis]
MPRYWIKDPTTCLVSTMVQLPNSSQPLSTKRALSAVQDVNLASVIRKQSWKSPLLSYADVSFALLRISKSLAEATTSTNWWISRTCLLALSLRFTMYSSLGSLAEVFRVHFVEFSRVLKSLSSVPPIISSLLGRCGPSLFSVFLKLPPFQHESTEIVRFNHRRMKYLPTPMWRHDFDTAPLRSLLIPPAQRRAYHPALATTTCMIANACCIISNAFSSSTKHTYQANAFFTSSQSSQVIRSYFSRSISFPRKIPLNALIECYHRQRRIAKKSRQVLRWELFNI